MLLGFWNNILPNCRTALSYCDQAIDASFVTNGAKDVATKLAMKQCVNAVAECRDTYLQHCPNAVLFSAALAGAAIAGSPVARFAIAGAVSAAGYVVAGNNAITLEHLVLGAGAGAACYKAGEALVKRWT